MDPLSVEGRERLADLRKAAEMVSRLSESVPPPRVPTDVDLSRSVAADISQGAILFDSSGYSPGGRDLILARAREYLQKLSDALHSFEGTFQPFQSTIEAFDSIPRRIAELEERCTEEIAAEKAKLDRERVGQEYLSTQGKI